MHQEDSSTLAQALLLDSLIELDRFACVDQNEAVRLVVLGQLRSYFVGNHLTFISWLDLHFID